MSCIFRGKGIECDEEVLDERKKGIV